MTWGYNGMIVVTKGSKRGPLMGFVPIFAHKNFVMTLGRFDPSFHTFNIFSCKLAQSQSWDKLKVLLKNLLNI